MSENLGDSFIDASRIGGLISGETRAFMEQMLEFAEPPLPFPTSQPPNPPPLQTRERNIVQSFSPPLSNSLSPSPHLSSLVPSLIALVGRILQELETNLPRLLSLNPSRREAIAHHLDRLAGIVSQPSTTSSDPSLKLRSWIEGTKSPAQSGALKSYFEEVSIIALGQAILLKNWSDRGIRRWSETDVGRLNWALSTALKPHVPLDRENWQITRPNLYSWYTPSLAIQHEIWSSLDAWRMTDEGSNFLKTLLNSTRRAQSEVNESVGYDSKFFNSLWENMALFGFNPEPEPNVLNRSKIVFSPTLRDGSLVRISPPSLTWIGLETSPFQLMMAELMQLWWGPAAPPFWSVGTGLEVHTRDQLTFALGSPKPSVLSRIAEMEACDAAFLLEEHTIRTQGRNTYAARFREQLEKLPYFKKLRSAGTSLGALQACVALSKLRPGGTLLWAREEALCSKEGSEVLNFLLDRAKLCCEWDFSELEHSIPTSVPLYPKHLYLFQKETNLEARLSHRPTRHSLQGQLRSHIELSLVLGDAFQSIEKPSPPRGHWTVLSHLSPTPQRDWLEKWPDPTAHSMVRSLDQLRAGSLPLANFTTVRPTPEGDSSRNDGWSVHLSLRGLWLTADYSNGRRLVTQSLPRPGQEGRGSGFLVLVPDESWVAPLSTYLTSDWVQNWLDHQAERRGDRWILNEQVVKWIPVPKTILCALGVPRAKEDSVENSFALPLPGEWEKLASEVAYQPTLVKEALLKLPQDPSSLAIHAALFVRTARALENLESGQTRLFSIVHSDGRIRWRELMDVLPKSEYVAIPLHNKIRLSGTLPPHLPIGKIDKVKAPLPGILLATESGFTLHLSSENPLLINIIWDQLEGLSHPTWNELLQYVRLPRKVELAESTARDVLQSHGQQVVRLKEMKDLLSACQLF